jgi:hypothetical protein
LLELCVSDLFLQPDAVVGRLSRPVFTFVPDKKRGLIKLRASCQPAWKILASARFD